MQMQVFLILTHFFVIYAITVPPIWPSKNQGIIRDEITEAPIFQGQFKFPNFFPEDLTRSSTRNQPANHQNVLIYHPSLVNVPSQSFQAVNFDDQTLNRPIYSTTPRREQINKKPSISRIPKRRPSKRKLPVVHQHLTEVTATQKPRNFHLKPAPSNIKISRIDVEDEENSEHSEQEVVSKENISEHELPKEIPTRPNYPGEGQWSKFGLKHNPNPQNREEIKVEETAEDDRPPEGYEIFERGDEQFTIARNKFRNNSPPSRIINEEPEEPLYKKPELGFIPQKLYTQVRRTEDEKHLPRSEISADEENAERLRETVKDSIIHTVYTEEGYEDSAYDHAGHEKNAENSEGHEESLSDHKKSGDKGHGRGNSRYSGEGGRRYGHNNVARRLNNNAKTSSDDFKDDDESYKNTKRNDAEEAASKKVSTKAELPTKEFKKVTVKNQDHEDVNMEIHTEIKYTPQLKKHKYVKIIPSVKETDKPQHTRVKRYDKEELSKRYIRKRPSYYWKRKRTTTTERTQKILNKDFENAFQTLTKKPARKTTTVPPEEEPITTTTTTTSSTTPYTITFPSVSKSTITTTPSHTSSGISPPKLVEELHPDLMNPELTTKASKPSAPKTLPVKIKKFVKKRPKRYAIDYPKIKVDLDEFVDVRNLPNPTEKPDLTFIKYPYYNLPPSEELDENSPLRYAEDTKNIPEKVENEMSFYESRNHIICKEVENDVNPVPDRIKNQEEGEETDKMGDAPDLPRLKELGDKIDCFKEKYFGENPLDSPFFQEDIIEAPIPLFMLKPRNYKKKMAATNAMYYKMKKQEQDGHTKKRELKIKILEPIVVLDDDYMESATVNPNYKTTEAVLKPPYTLEQMMSMQNEKFVRFNPQNDFDQISLLEQQSNKKEAKPDKFLIIYENQDAEYSNNTPEIKPRQQQKKKLKKTEKIDHDSRFSEIVSDLTSSSFNQVPERILSSTTPKPETFTRKHFITRATKKPITKLSIKSIRKPTHRTTTTTTTTATPETTAYNYNLYTTKRFPYYSEIIPQPSRIFQTTTAPTTSTTTTKYEQLEKLDSTEDQEEIKNPEESAEITSTNPPDLPENWPTLNRRLSAFYNIFDITQYFSPLPNPKIAPNDVQYKEDQRSNDQMKVYDDVLKTINENKEEKNSDKQQKPETSSEEAIIVQGSLPVRTSTEQNVEYSEKIVGLVPPPDALPYQQVYQYYNQYRLDPPPSEEEIAEASKKYKTFYFVGLKPPTIQKKRLKRDINQNEEDLLAEESKINENYVRIKRYPAESRYSSPQRKYTEIVRNRPPRPQNEDPEDEEEEDLNPRKRIYELKSTRSTTTTTESYPEFEEIVEEEQTEAPTTRKPKIYPVEANKQNPQIAEYIVFIEKLKEKWAKEDATSTTSTSTTAPTSTTSAASTKNRGEPAFLQIISQLHQLRKEEEVKTTTEPAIEITSAKVEAIPIKNSNPFLAEIGLTDSFMSELKKMQLNLDHDNTAEGSTNPEISRTRDYINRFRTTVDTSKYKTIERNPVNVRHNFSSRYNAEDEDLPLKRGTTQTPTIIAIITKPEDDGTTESPEEREIIAKVITERIFGSTEPETSSTSTTSTSTTSTSTAASTTTLKSRQRGRGRPRPPSTTLKPTSSSSLSSTPNPLFRRRRPTRPTTTTTTPSSLTTSSNQFRRRNRLKAAETRSPLPVIPQNHKPISEETTETTVVITPPSEEPKKQRRFQKVQERRVTSEVVLTRYFEPLSDEAVEESGVEESRQEESEEEDPEESKKHQYEVIGPLTHTDTRHGGNYRREDEPTSSEESSTLSNSESFFSDPDLAGNVNLLKDAVVQQEGTAKPQASNNLFTNEEIQGKVATKPLHSKVNLYPNMARMVNRLADSQTNENQDDDDDGKEEKPVFIKDPSRRMYYYAKL